MDNWIKREEHTPAEKAALLCCNRHGNRFVALFNRWNGPHWDAFGVLRLEFTEVEHWMLLPDPTVVGTSCLQELPPEGTPVLCGTLQGGCIVGCLKRDKEACWEAFGTLRLHFGEVTHWMPLPDPPIRKGRSLDDWVA